MMVIDVLTDDAAICITKGDVELKMTISEWRCVSLLYIETCEMKKFDEYRKENEN